MQPRAPVPSKRPTAAPLHSKYPGLSPLASIWPFVKSLRPGGYNPSILTLPPETETKTGPDAPTTEIPVKSWIRGRFARRVAQVSLVALGGGVAFLATRAGHFSDKGVLTRTVTAPTLKAADKGGHVRWHKDAVDVVVDKSFTDLAGPSVFGAAVDAWRASGATLPSVSTVPGDGKKVGYEPKGANENVVVFAPYGWAKAHGALAVTVLTFDSASGDILDADVLVNGGGRFFANFDHDESNGDDGDVSIEDVPGTITVTTQSKHATTPRFDVQSVVTHELGHFFGLGEDYDDKAATMYATTRPGEIHKRMLKQTESSVITALYAESSPEDAKATKGGCGRAQLARGDSPGSASWMGFFVATLGLGLLAASRRGRADELRVRVRTGDSRRSRKWGRVGGWLTVTGLVALLSPPELQAATDLPTVRGDADVQVLGAAPRWADGVMETELTFRVTTCRVDPCPDGDQHVVVQGGSLGGVTQVIGPFAVPDVGARMTVKLRDGRGLLKLLDPTFRP